MDKQTVRFKAEKATKNTIKFEEVTEEGKPPIVGSLYVQKWFVGDTAEIEVTISPVKAGK